MSIARLKSGTDLRGVALGDKERLTLTEDDARLIGKGFATWLAKRTSQNEIKVAVGRDSRLTGDALSRALREGLCAGGAIVYDLGLATTPAMFEATRCANLDCVGAVMTTASHLPKERNGFKFITRDGGLDASELAELIGVIDTMPPSDWRDDSREFAFLPMYCERLTRVVTDALGQNTPLSGLKVALDASNGAGGFYADWLSSMGADTSGSVNLEPNGAFPSHEPNPENADAIACLTNATLTSSADIGVILDADCDRAALVAGDGSPLNRERLIALCAELVARQEPHCVIVTDSVTSSALSEFIDSVGATHRRFKRGYKNVIEEARRIISSGKACPLAMETSGHAAFAFNNFLDDGMMLATLIIIEAVRAKRDGKNLIDRIASLPLPAEDVEERVAVAAKEERDEILIKMARWLRTDEAKRYYSPDDEPEGIRAELLDGSGWFLLRSSLHDPLIVWNAQSYKEGLVREMRNDVRRATGV